ncbi:MAG TPA: ferredoxin--NADP reductase [Burkholderiales bacterium]|jgi:ferredoxin--NADP+ reductase|nr:ferredoxin--NADP reductase [Burkholderiales bacterium]
MLPAAPATAKFTVERITALLKRTPTLINFRTTRDVAFRFNPGHYARLGLGEKSAEVGTEAGTEAGTGTGDAGQGTSTAPADAAVWRPYSIASPAAAPFLDFQLTLVPGGDFCERFNTLREGDAIRVDARSFGFLTLDQLAPGGTLWMFSTGTGLAPFISILATDALWQRHPRVVLTHSVRYGNELMPDVIDTALASRSAEERARFTYMPIVTREAVAGTRSARLPELWRSGELEQAGGAALDAEHSRAMLCGNPEMIKEMRAMLKERAMGPSRRGVPGQLAAEGYW